MKDKIDLSWMLDRYEQTSDRYMEAEKFLIDIIYLPFYKRFFLSRKIVNFIKSQQEKYKF